MLATIARRRVLPLMLGMLLLSACGSMGPKVTPPTLTVLKISMTSADMFNQQFIVRVRAQNPNDRDLAIAGIDYHLFVAGDSFAEGVSKVPVSVPALGENEFDLPVTTHFVSSLGRLVSRLNGQTKTSYLVEGTVFLPSGMMRKVPFRQSGEVDLALMK